MARTNKDFETRKQQIIDGALAVFAEKGFEKATNKDIAKASGVGSPGLIYHYFKDKWDLFQNVIIERAPFAPLLQQRDTLMDQPPRDALTHIATTMLTGVSNPKTTALGRIVFGEAMRHPQVARMLHNATANRFLNLVEDYLRHQMDIGTLKRADPKAAAACFLGPLMAYAMTHDFFQFDNMQDLDRETMAKTAVNIFLNGLAVKSV